MGRPRNPNKPVHQITSIQLACLRAIAKDGDASDWRRNTPDSLHARGLIERVVLGKPHPRVKQTRRLDLWRPTELGNQVLAHWAGKTRTGA